jgi:hypothetical protein
MMEGGYDGGGYCTYLIGPSRCGSYSSTAYTPRDRATVQGEEVSRGSKQRR